MNKESLNEFYEADKFHKKLREKIDAHEPELSDSLWDRIEHDLNRKENSNKRVLWLVYVLSGLLLVSGGALFYLWGENQKLASDDAGLVYEQSNPSTSNSPSTIDLSTVPSQVNPEQSGQTAGTISPSTSNGVDVPPTQVRPNLALTPASNDHNGLTPAHTQTSTSVSTSSSNTVDKTNELAGAANNTSNENQEEPALADNAQVEVNPETELIGEAAVQTKEISNLGKETKEPVKQTPKVRPVLFASVYSGFNKINQRALNGEQEMLKRFERELVTTEYGINLGVQFKNGLSLSSGIGSYVTGQEMKFNIRTFVVSSPTPGIQEYDSILSGNENTLINKQYWIEVPVMIGYQYSIGKWSGNVQAGTGFNMINNFSGYSASPDWSGFDPDGTRNVQPYKNFISLKSNLGISYSLTPKLQVGAGATYRRALGSSTRTPANPIAAEPYPERRPISWGGRFSLTYLLR